MRADARFRAMGTEVHLIAVASSIARAVGGALDRGRERIEELEALWSRFRPTSEMSVAERDGGHAGRGSRPRRSRSSSVRSTVSALTGGRFDPTVLGAVVRAGYDRTYEEVGPGCRRRTTNGELGAPLIEVDPVALLVRLPEGVGFDPGGIGKGLAADIVGEELADRVDGICVNIGGDLRVRAERRTAGAGGSRSRIRSAARSRGALCLATGRSRRARAPSGSSGTAVTT